MMESSPVGGLFCYKGSMTKREAKHIAYSEILDFIEYTIVNPSEGDDGNPRPLEDRQKIEAAYEAIWNEIARRIYR